MYEDVFIVAIIFGFSAFILSGIYKLIKLKITQGNGGMEEEAFNRLANAFMQHKKEMQERVKNLEAIIANEDKDSDFDQIEAPKNEGNLSNDLEQKNKVRS